MFRFILLLFFINILIDQSLTYRILGVFPLSGRSHEMMFESLMKGLAKRGHQVDVITHFPVKNPPKNYKNIVNLSGTMENLVNNFTMDFVLSMTGSEVDLISTHYGNRLCHLMGLDEMQNVIRNPPNDPPYDIVITEVFGANCYLGLGKHFNVPVVAVSPAVEYPWVSHFTGNNDNLAIVPNALMMVFGEMNFWQRLYNVIVNYQQVQKFHKLTEESQTESMRRYINPNMPNIREIENSVALTLVNSHPLLFGTKPVIGGLVEIAGVHIEENDSELPNDLKEWLDESKDGVIYFTFGSMVLVETLDEEIIKSFYASFEKIAPIRVLMKIADVKKLPPGLPSNIKTSKWIPQQPVLAHKNVKAFITHGGLMGSLESLYYGVPMIGVPLFADQPRNVEAFVAKNMSIKLLLADISEKTLDKALDSILNNPKYRENAAYYSRIFRDRPLSAMDTAEFWIGFVIRNGGDILHIPDRKIPWWKLSLLDVYSFILFSVILTFIVMLKFIKFILNLVAKLLFDEDEKKSKKRN